MYHAAFSVLFLSIKEEEERLAQYLMNIVHEKADNLINTDN
jgi:hypothetical protein